MKIDRDLIRKEIKRKKDEDLRLKDEYDVKVSTLFIEYLDRISDYLVKLEDNDIEEFRVSEYDFLDYKVPIYSERYDYHKLDKILRKHFPKLTLYFTFHGGIRTGCKIINREKRNRELFIFSICIIIGIGMIYMLT